MDNNDKQNSKGNLIVTDNDQIDAKKIAARIQENIRQKMSNGAYDLDEVDRVAGFKPEMPAEGSIPDKQILEVMESHWDVIKPIGMETHRTGAKAKVVKLAKKAYEKLLHNPMKLTLHRQAMFNQAVKAGWAEFSYLRPRYISLSQRLAKVEEFANSNVARIDERIDELGPKITEIDSKFSEETGSLSTEIASLNRIILDLDKQGIFLKNRLKEILGKIETSANNGANLVKAAEEEKAKLDSFDYSLFENIHRGTRHQIKERMKVYADWFEGLNDVLDVGCGRGELLEIFKENGIGARGVDTNVEMVNECNKLGLNVTEGDALAYLESLDDKSLGGVTAIQLVEHLPVDVMAKFFQLAYSKLKPGGVIAAETINAACLTTFCGAFYLDLSHVKPIHPLALQFLLERSGFENVRVEYLSPYDEDIRLHTLPADGGDGGLDKSIIHEYNQNVMKLNNVLYSHADYAVVAKKMA